ncbi:MAG: right-handed parallel beta-helix repeat-containing protein, partial [Candidatus Cloacimonetes bacterium]|nr:right-handed parallel beta-helix repeat-containing protein [Candidatus Cloacimonadota bacterium]
NIIEDNNCVWYQNGCGIGIQNSSANIINNIIRNNNGAYHGGGIYVYQSDNVVIENNIIYGHFTVSGSGVDYGAGICLNQSNDILIKKNLIYDNIVGFHGSGIALRSSSGFIFGNTIFNNSCTDWGNNVYINNNSTADIKNSILWSDDINFGVEIASQGFVNVSYSNIKGGYDGINNINRNPLFEDIINRDFQLTIQSPCINSGDPTSAYDPDGTIADIGYFYFDMSDYGSLSGLVTLAPGIGNIENVTVTIDSFTVIPFSDGYYIFNLLPGFYNVTASLGLHCEQTINNVQVIQNEVTTGIDFYLDNTNINIVIEINQDGTGDFTAIQDGINAAINGDTILVYQGTYYENINILEKSIILGSRFLTSNDSTFISETIIDGSNYDSTISIENVEDTTCVINGFTIRNGNAVINGGGIYCYYSSPQILNCNITENYSDPHGGGIYCDNSNPIIKNNKIFNNSSLFNGGGISSYDSSPILINNKIHNNTTTHTNSRGGGLYFNHSSPIIINCNISDNCSSSAGGAISFMYNEGDFSMINNILKGNIANIGGALQIHSQSNGVIINNLIVENNAVVGGGLYLQTTFISPYCPDIINCTIANNQSELYGGGIFFAEFSNSNIINSIICENESDIGEQICLNSWYSDPNFYYSDIEDGFNGFGFTGTASIEDYEGEYENNILLDPLFIEPETGNFQLLEDSPCIDAGIPDTTGLNLPP